MVSAVLFLEIDDPDLFLPIVNCVPTTCNLIRNQSNIFVLLHINSQSHPPTRAKTLYVTQENVKRQEQNHFWECSEEFSPSYCS